MRLEENARLAAEEKARSAALAEQLRIEEEITKQQTIENERKRIEELPIAQTIPLDGPTISDSQ